MFAVYVKNPKKLSKQVERLPVYLQEKVSQAIDGLSDFPDIGQLKKLSNGGYRVRVEDYRILFDVDQKNRRIIVYDVAHRREAYR